MKKGFTLIELSIVLIIIGLLTGGAFQMIKVMQEKARATEAKQTLEAAKEAIISFSINTNHLPTATEFTTMNLKGAGNIDIFYNADPALQTNLCDSTSTLSVIDSSGVTIPNIGFVLAVAGENFNIQTGRIGNTITFHPWNTTIDDNPNPIDRAEPYDDLYVNVTLGELQATADCQTNKFKIINTTLPVGTVGTPYTLNSTVVTTGGTPSCSTPPTAPCAYTVNGLSGSGLVFSPGTNTISGTPATANNYPLTFTATNGTAQDTKSLLLVISEPVGTGGTGTSTYQQCIDTCIAGGKNPTACAAQCK